MDHQTHPEFTGSQVQLYVTAHRVAAASPEEADWNKGIYPQTLIIPNLEHRHKKGKNV